MAGTRILRLSGPPLLIRGLQQLLLWNCLFPCVRANVWWPQNKPLAFVNCIQLDVFLDLLPLAFELAPGFHKPQSYLGCKIQISGLHYRHMEVGWEGGGEGWQGEMLIQCKQTVHINVKPHVDEWSIHIRKDCNLSSGPSSFAINYEHLLTLLGVLSGAFWSHNCFYNGKWN